MLASAILGSRLSISVLIPIRRELPNVAENARGLRLEEAELLVADAGESSETAAAYTSLGARVLTAPGSRGARLRQAAASARGDILFFLHADSRPPENALELIRGAVAGGAATGAFSLAFEDGGPALAAIAAWANARSRWWRLPFGDQGIFCRREAYERAGGFADLSVCDDMDLVRRLRRAGPFRMLPEKTLTSPRRYLENGVLRQGARNLAVQLGYLAGMPQKTLERWYAGGPLLS
jgi:rSAM/selenodomain-associated transferase 2